MADLHALRRLDHLQHVELVQTYLASGNLRGAVAALDALHELLAEGVAEWERHA